MAYDLFRRRQVPGNWALTNLSPSSPLPGLAPTPKRAIDYLSMASQQAKTTDLKLSKSSFKVTKKFAF
jgi:hypothetical protein